MENFNLTPIEHCRQRVLTTAQLAEAYKTESKIISNNFNRNKKRYIEGKHFYRLTGDDVEKFCIHHFDEYKNHSKIRILYLWTEKGALLHAKSLNTDKAWEVYEFLVDTYFRVKELKPDYNEILLMLVQKQYELEKRIEKLENTEHAVSYSLAIEENNSIVFDFINECCERRCGICNNITTADLYNAFQKWCFRKNTNVISKYTFINQLCIYFQTDEKNNIRKNIAGKWYYLITLTPSAVKMLEFQK